MKQALTYVLFALVLPACSSGGQAGTGLGEPIVVRYRNESRTPVLAQFMLGKMPGSQPAAVGLGTGGGTGVTSDTSASKTLQATITDYSEPYVYQGQGNVPVSGIASNDVTAVAVALEGLGSGYWIVPIVKIDGPTLQPKWEMIADLAPNVPEGFRYLQFVGIDGNGRAGTIQTQKICVASRVPDDFLGCKTNSNPPAAVISLSWDSNVDLDLQVMTPDGKLVQPKNPLTADLDAGAALPADIGRIDRDSNGNCVIDNIRYENLVWKQAVPHGRYGLYVNLFDSCKQPSVHFNLQVYTALDVEGADAGTKALYSWRSWDGILLDFQANGGTNIGFFVSNFDL